MRFTRLGSVLLYGLAAAVPTTLLISSVRVFGALEDQKAIYLRSRVAALAAHLEIMPGDEGAFEVLSAEEPGLVDVQTFQREQAPSLARMWDGKELFRTTTIETADGAIFRAHIPFHRNGAMRIAQIDLDPDAADFLLSHARHHVAVAFVSALALAALSVYAVWSARRTHLLRQRQLQLQHLAKLGEMSAGLAHEIRNPLGTIKGFAQLLAETAVEKQRPLIEPIVAETLRLESLVEDLLRFGRPPLPSICPVQWAAIEEALCAHACSFHGRFVYSGRNFPFRTDPKLLEQALLNLLRNAFEAAGDAGEVRVEVAENSRKLRISVLDDGPGMPPEARQRLFEPFYTTKALGTGLGLSISRKLVESIGGSLELRERKPKGTEAVIELPHSGESET